MFVKHILSQKQSLSLEIFPPKAGMPLAPLFPVVDGLAGLKPAFISITCGAMGTQNAHTAEGAAYIQKAGARAVAHLTCTSLPEGGAQLCLQNLKNLGVQNILALRGDIPEGQACPKSAPYASSLISAIKAFGGFCIGAACYPEAHPESPSPKADIASLKIKAECGADFFISQLFFDNARFYRFLDALRGAGVSVPVLAGIMPPLKAGQINKMCALSHAGIPPALQALLSRYESDDASMAQAGLDFACAQMEGLLKNGVQGLHLYTMNKTHTAKEIFSRIGGLLGTQH